MLIKPGKIRFISLLVAALLAMPLPFGNLTGSFIWMSPFILLNTTIAQQAFHWFNIIGLVILILIFVKDRFFCRYLCPVGVLCDPVSRFAGRKLVKRKFPDIARSILIISIILSLFGFPILSIIDPVNAFNAFFDPVHSGFSFMALIKTTGLLIIVMINLLFPHAWCHKICPLGGLQFLVTDVKRLFTKSSENPTMNFKKSRRYFIAGVLGAGTGLLLPQILKARDQVTLRPPGILADKELRFVCSRCGNCLKSCPTNIIQPLTITTDWMNLFTPRVDFKQSYCLTDCNQCGNVCPTGAIRKFSTGQKNQLFIGCAELTPELCLLTRNQECDRCKFSCDYDAIEITGSFNYSAIPVIIREKCVGCGACQVACPTNAIVIKPVVADQHF